jgi:hypothetical protein
MRAFAEIDVLKLKLSIETALTAFCLTVCGTLGVGIVDAVHQLLGPWLQRLIKPPLPDTEKLLIHAFRNCVHKIHMELDLAERGLVEESKYADLISAVDSMNVR